MNMKSFDEQEIRGVMRESGQVVREAAEQGSFETVSEEEDFFDAIEAGVSGMIELVQRGHATPAQEEALLLYLENNGVI